MGLHLTRRALADVDEIDGYSVERWGEKVASRYLDDLQAALDLLRDQPSLLRPRPDCSLRLLFYRVREHVLICDRISEETYVLAVRHGSMDLPARLLELEPQLVFEAEVFRRRVEGRPG